MTQINRHECIAAVPRLQNVSALDHFHHEVSRILSSGGDDSFWECEDLFSAILLPECMSAIVNHELKSCVEGEFYVPDCSGEHLLTLMRTPAYCLELIVAPPVLALPQSLYGLSYHCMLGLVSKGPAELAFYRQPVPFPNEVFDRTRSLVPEGTGQLSQYKFLKFQAGYETYSPLLSVTEHVYLLFKSKQLSRLLWEYSAESLKPARAIAVDASASRLQYAARLLSAMSYEEALPNLFGLMKHPDHFVRWTVVQSILQLDLEKGMEAVQMAMHDPHPHVRNAAARALDLAHSEA